MKKNIRQWVAWIIALTLLFSMNLHIGAEESLEAFYIKSIIETVAENYRFDISKEKLYEKVVDLVFGQYPQLLEEGIQAIMEDLDPYSEYLGSEELEEFTGYIGQHYVGIGVTIERTGGYVVITAVSPDSPAEKAGLLSGDKFVEVDGIDVTDYSVSRLQSVVLGEEGTAVTVTVLRGEETKTFLLVRASIQVSSVSFEEMEGIGYLRIVKFNSSTPKEVKEGLEAFANANITKLIVDVRNNPGGELGGVIKTLELFVPKGKVLTSIDYKDDSHDVTIKSEAVFTKPPYQMVVLINENSASASELFAGAIRDNELGKTIGIRSYGKGTVQEFLGLRSPANHSLGDIKLTIAQYFLPGGESIHETGIIPDIRVKNEENPIDTSEFEPLTYAAKYKNSDTGAGVLAIKQRLDALGLDVGEVNDVFDKETELAVYNFQAATELYPYGVMDITTQIKLNEMVNTVKLEVDRQLEYAIEYFTEGR